MLVTSCNLRARMKKRWEVLRAAVLNGKVRPTVPSEDAKSKPDYLDKAEEGPTNLIGPSQSQTSIGGTLSRWDNAIRQLVLQATTTMGKGKVSPASEVDSTHEPPPVQEAPTMSTGCVSEPPASGLRWRRVIHQLVSESNGSKRAPEASYCPSLPTPVGPFPPPAFSYSSPAHRADLILSEAETEPEIGPQSDFPPAAFNLV